MERVSSTNNIVYPLMKNLAQEMFKCQYKTMGLIHKGNLL